MNCNQARALLAAYRELKNEEVDTIELDVHLEECASCRQELARSMFIGEKVRSLPVIETPPDMHVKLMRALAHEQVEFIRRSAPGRVSTPEFLKPYLLEHAQSTHRSDLIAAFSTAETGPLPIIQAKRKPRPRSHMNQFAVIGLAATFLMLLMMGGITSLLLLSHNNLQGNATKGIVDKLPQQAAVEQAKYTTSTFYQHVVSAVADRTYIYYTAYADGPNDLWMLESLNRTTKISTPLLAIASTYPLIVLGSSNSGLVWLQLDESTSITHKNLPGYSQWSLDYLSSGQQQQAAFSTPEVLLTGTFDQSKAPAWVTTPVQGIWFVQNSLLVATIDANGISHLLRYQLDALSKPVVTQIATAAPGHVLTSPTANSDGTQIYWSDEWLSNTGILYSNIWTQQVFDATRPSHWQWPGQTVKVTLKVQFTSDGMSFRPQVVDNTLFFLRSARPVNSTQATATTVATPTTTATATPTPATTPNASTISRTETSIYAAPPDASVRGTILRLQLDSNPMILTTSVDNLGLGLSLQAGTHFALWQKTDKGYAMYDEQTQSPVTIGEALNSASFVAVNGTTAVWMINDKTDTTSPIIPTVTLIAFNWPK